MASSLRPRLGATILIVSLIAAACGGGGSKASSCSEYAADVREVINSTASPEAVQKFLSDTEELVAKLLLEAGNTTEGQKCADAISDAIITIADRGFAQLGN